MVETVKVVVRCRPLMGKEKTQGHKNIVTVDEKNGTVDVNGKELGKDSKRYTYDQVYGQTSKQEVIYKNAFNPLIQSAIDGYNGTIFAYGQTGTGKTHTMEGIRDDPVEKGVIPRSFDQIFSHIEDHGKNDAGTIDQYLVRASYLEIYQEEIKDLLSKDVQKKLDLRENPDKGVYVKDLLSFVVKSTKEIGHVMKVGNSNRSVGKTNMNEHSSRSHAIFIITIECATTDQSQPNEKASIRVGKLNLVDLAGSERQSKTGSTGQRLAEATKINLSLSTLGNVISSLVRKDTHIPYRDSKLTRLLQDSLGGNSKTVMVANIGPANYNYDETCNTLRYANRAKHIKNKPKINEDPKDAMLREFQTEIAKLRQQLTERATGSAPRKRVLKVAEDGTEYYSEESDGENADDEEIQELKEQLEAEKEVIRNKQGLHENEREKLLSAANDKLDEIKTRQQKNDKMRARLQNIEAKLLIGGIPIEKRTVEQQQELERKRKVIAQTQAEEKQLKEHKNQAQEEFELVNRKFTNAKEEVDVKTRKLKKLFSRLQQFKVEIEDVAAEQADEREELQKTQTELGRELKLYQLLAEAFVPPEHKIRIENRAVYDDEEALWTLEEPKANIAGLTKRPVSAFGKNKRPQSAYTKMAAQVNGNPRYRTDNILQVELDLPSRTTTDFLPGGSGISAPNLELGGGRLGHKTNDVEQFHPEDVIEIEATPDVFSRSRTKVGSGTE